jgi:hypothetical protein
MHAATGDHPPSHRTRTHVRSFLIFPAIPAGNDGSRASYRRKARMEPENQL